MCSFFCVATKEKRVLSNRDDRTIRLSCAHSFLIVEAKTKRVFFESRRDNMCLLRAPRTQVLLIVATRNRLFLCHDD